jgi:ribonucleotide monophosphatase NagD (HAD superfamily)
LATIEEHAGREISKSKILAIGDGLRTDIRGALNAEIPCMFVAGGIHGNELVETDGGVNREALKDVIEEELGSDQHPQFVLTSYRLVW